mmetsp:Transcript_10506/g.43507  ORF Transcript_10506/g.43507 Transcript_10506/m.43507 type:complete len:337 (+) Transcript_10506:1081-2091(+)
MSTRSSGRTPGLWCGSGGRRGSTISDTLDEFKRYTQSQSSSTSTSTSTSSTLDYDGRVVVVASPHEPPDRLVRRVLQLLIPEDVPGLFERPVIHALAHWWRDGLARDESPGYVRILVHEKPVLKPFCALRQRVTDAKRDHHERYEIPEEPTGLGVRVGAPRASRGDGQDLHRRVPSRERAEVQGGDGLAGAVPGLAHVPRADPFDRGRAGGVVVRAGDVRGDVVRVPQVGLRERPLADGGFAPHVHHLALWGEHVRAEQGVEHLRVTQHIHGKDSRASRGLHDVRGVAAAHSAGVHEEQVHGRVHDRGPLRAKVAARGRVLGVDEHDHDFEGRVRE